MELSAEFQQRLERLLAEELGEKAGYCLVLFDRLSADSPSTDVAVFSNVHPKDLNNVLLSAAVQLADSSSLDS